MIPEGPRGRLPVDTDAVPWDFQGTVNNHAAYAELATAQGTDVAERVAFAAEQLRGNENLVARYRAFGPMWCVSVEQPFSPTGYPPPIGIDHLVTEKDGVVYQLSADIEGEMAALSVGARVPCSEPLAWVRRLMRVFAFAPADDPSALYDAVHDLCTRAYVAVLESEAQALALRDTPQSMMAGQRAPERAVEDWRPPLVEGDELRFFANFFYPGTLVELIARPGSLECEISGPGQTGGTGIGRPFMDDEGVPVLPAVERGAGARTEVGDAFESDARFEHASIGAFSRAVIELMAHAAPLALVERLHEAALDESRHARVCLELAERADGVARELGAMDVPNPREQSLADLARATFLEGSVAERLSSLEIARGAARAEDPEVRERLESIAEDERSHAELADDIVEWAIEQEPSAVRAAVQLASHLPFPPASVEGPSGACGRPTDEDRAEARVELREEIARLLNALGCAS